MNFSPYMIMAGFGALAGLLVLNWNLAGSTTSRSAWVKTNMAVLAGGMAVLPAARLGQWVFTVGVKNIFSAPWRLSGISFYPGLLGFLGAAALAALLLRLPVAGTMNTIAPSVPLLHAFGRVGCWFGGCCYGVPVYWSLFGRTIPNLPTQLMEAAFCLGLFFMLQYKVKTHRVPVYLSTYAVWRFFLEFLRGDEHRGSLLPGVPGTPAQQIAAMCLLSVGLWLLLKKQSINSAAKRNTTKSCERGFAQ